MFLLARATTLRSASCLILASWQLGSLAFGLVSFAFSPTRSNRNQLSQAGTKRLPREGSAHSTTAKTFCFKLLNSLFCHQDNKMDTQEGNIGQSRRRDLLNKFVRGVESLRVPKFLHSGNVPLISGIGNVVYGTQPACEVVVVAGIRPPRYLCYMLSGFICDLIQFMIDLFLHVSLKLEDASLCWILGFVLSIVFRHTTHRYLVFGDYVGGYWKSLSRMYAGYSVTIFLSTVFNFIMARYIQFPHYVAWIVTLLWTGVVNYFILKRLWSFGEKSKDAETSIQSQETLPLKDVQLVQRKRVGPLDKLGPMKDPQPGPVEP